MLYRLHVCAALSCLLLVSACASKPDRNRDSSVTFNTEIKSNGSKRFTLSIVESARGAQRKQDFGDANRGQRGGREQRGERGQRGGGKRSGNGQDLQSGNDSITAYEDNRARAIALLDEWLAQTQYCRNGYIELDYSSIKGETELLAECQESASEEDKLKW